MRVAKKIVHIQAFPYYTFKTYNADIFMSANIFKSNGCYGTVSVLVQMLSLYRFLANVFIPAVKMQCRVTI